MSENLNSSNSVKYLTLDKLPIGNTATIDSIHLKGPDARRLLDLGFVTGNTVTPLFKSFLGDPICYKIMDTKIALRRRTSSSVDVYPTVEVAHDE